LQVNYSLVQLLRIFEAVPIKFQQELVASFDPCDKSDKFAKFVDGQAPKPFFAERESMEALTPDILGPLLRPEIRRDYHPSIAKYFLVHSVTVVVNFEASSRRVVRVLQPHVAVGRVCIISVFHQLEDGEICVADELITEQPEQARFYAENQPVAVLGSFRREIWSHCFAPRKASVSHRAQFVWVLYANSLMHVRSCLKATLSLQDEFDVPMDVMSFIKQPPPSVRLALR
jgi:hypothetical protein